MKTRTLPWEFILTSQELVLVGGSADDFPTEGSDWHTPRGILNGTYTTPDQRREIQDARRGQGYIRTSLLQTVPGVQIERGQTVGVILSDIDLESGKAYYDPEIVAGIEDPQTRLLVGHNFTREFVSFNETLGEGRVPLHFRSGVQRQEGGRRHPEQ